MARLVGVIRESFRALLNMKAFLLTGAYLFSTLALLFVVVILGIFSLLIVGLSAAGPLDQMGQWLPRVLQLWPAFLVIILVLLALWLGAQSFLTAFFLSGYRAVLKGGAFDASAWIQRMKERWSVVFGVTLLQLVAMLVLLGVWLLPLFFLFGNSLSNPAALAGGVLVALVWFLLGLGAFVLVVPFFQLWAPFAVFGNADVGHTISNAVSAVRKNYLHVLGSVVAFMVLVTAISMAIGLLVAVLSVVPLLGTVVSILVQIALNLGATLVSMAFVIHLYESVLPNAH